MLNYPLLGVRNVRFKDCLVIIKLLDENTTKMYQYSVN